MDQRMDAQDHQDRIFSAEFIETLAKTFHVPAPQLSEFRRQLEFYARRFQHRHALQERKGPVADQRKLFSKLSADADRLKATLNQMTDDLWRDVAEAGYLINSAPHEARIDHIDRDPDDIEALEPPTFTLPSKDPRSCPIVLDLSSLKDMLDVLSDANSAAAAFLPKPRKGAKANWPLDAWIEDMRSLWNEVLGRNFTRDIAADGTPISEAAQLCVEAFRVLSPGTPSSRVHNAMKLRIKKDRDWINRKRKPT